jgi:hypothetical protein
MSVFPWSDERHITHKSAYYLVKLILLLVIKLNSVALVRKRTIPTERPPLVGEVMLTFEDIRCREVSATDPTAANLGFLDPEPLLFNSSSSSVMLTRLSGPSSRPTTSQKIW